MGKAKIARGRPALQMTTRRRQVLAAYADLAEKGHDIRLAEIARRCGLYDYRDARRIVTDLRRMGKLLEKAGRERCSNSARP